MRKKSGQTALPDDHWPGMYALWRAPPIVLRDRREPLLASQLPLRYEEAIFSKTPTGVMRGKFSVPSLLCGNVSVECAASAAVSAPARATRLPLRLSLEVCLCSRCECVCVIGKSAPRASMALARRMMVALLYGWRSRKRSFRPSEIMVLCMWIAAVLSTAWTTSNSF